MAGLALDETGLSRVVDAFYARVRADAELGPVFNDAVHDWPEHLDKLSAFWSSVMLRTGAYKGNPLATHREVQGMAPELFARWLALFGETAREVCAEEIAESFEAKARNIAESLKLGLFYRPGDLRVLPSGGPA